MIRVAIASLTVALLVASAPAQATTRGKETNGAPPPCIYIDGKCYEPCTDPSGMCPPSDASAYYPSYSWMGPATGTYWQDEFTGNSVNSNVWQIQGQGGAGYKAGGSGTDQLWEDSSNTVSVSDGAVNLSTYYDSGGNYESDCQRVWSTNNCWISGGLIQCGDASQGTCSSSFDPWMTSGQIAVEAKVTNGVLGIDSDVQMGGYGWGNSSSTTFGPNCNVLTTPECSWPPEMDVMEQNDNSLAAFSATLHCAGANPPWKTGDPPPDTNTADSFSGGESGYLKTGGVGAWNTYEMDWTSSSIKVFVNGGSTPVFQAISGGNLTGYGKTSQTLQCDPTYWPSSPSAAMGVFLQQSVRSTPGSQSDTSTLQVDCVAVIDS